MLKIKRIYEPPAPEDGYRILVDKLWPRGISKEVAAINEWNGEIAPSVELRKWFCHDPDLFDEFSKRYKIELSTKTDELERINAIAGQQNVTLVYAAKDPHINHAIVLFEVLKKLK